MSQVMGEKVSAAKSGQAVASIRTAPFFPAPPAWATALVNGGVTAFTEHQQIHRTAELLLVSLSFPARDLDGDAFESLVAQTYRALRTLLRPEVPKHPLRIWNFVPGILAPAGEKLDRYMRFNAGRYREFLNWFGGETSFDKKSPAASAVGHDGSDFVLHALCGREPVTPIVNPRQRAPHRYSKKFGPIPPCFARAVLAGHDQLIIGGTASVVDETSMHVGQLKLQLDETRTNLGALVQTAFGNGADPGQCIDHLRAYHVVESDRSRIERFLTTNFPKLKSLEFLVGELCRGDLLVEIEGHAQRI